MRRALPPALAGPAWARAVRSLSSRMPPNYRVLYKLAPESRWADVERTVKDDNASMPLIGVSREYWAEVSNAPVNESDIDHALIVLATTPEMTTVFDSYAAILAKSTHATIDRARPGLDLGVIRVATINLNRYWGAARVPKHVFWIQRVKPKGRQLTLGQSMGGQ